MKNKKHPFQDYEKQKNILINDRNLIIDDEKVLDLVLKDYSYYAIINGYKDIFLEPSSSKEKFKAGTTISMLYQVYWMDLTMSNLVFKYSLLVEKRLKSRLAYLIGNSFGDTEEQYLQKKNYSQAPYHRGKLSKVIDEIKNKKESDRSAKHYIDTEGNLPPWVATKAVSFGVAYIWYQILRDIPKNELVSKFINTDYRMTVENKKDYFYRLISQVYEFRNISAHGNRIFDFQFQEKYEMKRIYLESTNTLDLFENENRNGLFSVIYSIITLLDDPYALNNFWNEVINYFDNYSRPGFNFNGKDVFQLFGISLQSLAKLEEYVKQKIDII